MKTTKKQEKDNNVPINTYSRRSKLADYSQKQGSLRPLTAPQKSSYLLAAPRTSTPSPNRPKSTTGFYMPIPRPGSAQSFQSESSVSTQRSSSETVSRRKRQPKGDKIPTVIARGTLRKSVKPKVTIAWDDRNNDDKQLSTESKIADKIDGERKGKTRVSFQSRFAERSTRTEYKAMPFIPGSFSTMISVEESDENKSEGDGDPLQAPASPCFADVLSSGESSEYDTDLEEEFPVNNKEFDPSGKTLYIKMCKDKDLVPVSYFTERLKESEIIMRHHGLGTIGTLPLAKSLKKNTFIEKIDLTDNYIEGPGAVSLANMLQDNCFITDIDLSMNFIRSEGGVAFATMLYKNQSLRKLVLKSNHLTDKDAKVFAEALKENRTLEYLDISHNEIGELGGIYLGAGLAVNYGLKHFDVSWNCIRFKGAVGLAQSLKTNDCLTHFNMSWNGLSLLGCVALGRFLKRNEALVELDISNNRIGLLGTQKLAAGIAGHPNLKVLKIGRNPMGDVGVECLLSVVKTHNSISYLSLEDITVSPKVFDEIKALEAERNITIITGGIGGYKRPKEMPPGMRILLDFISDNRLRLIDWFNQFDKDHSGGISREEFRKGLKEIGLVMTTRQLDRLIEFIDINDDGEIEYSELLRGREITIQQLRIEKKMEERNKKIEEQRMKLPKLEGYDYDLM